MPGPDPLLSAKSVSRRFGYSYAIADVSLDVHPSEILLLIGHNGAGKTTLIRLLAGLLHPTAGEILRPDSVGMVAHDSMLYESLSARENMRFFARLQGMHKTARIDELLGDFGLAEHADRRVATYSRGMVQRLTLARALLPDPPLLLLDEPMTGLDDSALNRVRNILSDLRADDRAVVLATHQLADVLDVASDVGYLVKGRLKAIEPIDGRNARDITLRYREIAQHD